MAFELPDLPYKYDALEPHMSADTLRFHHDKHHKGYVDAVNKQLADLDTTGLSLDEVIQRSVDGGLPETLFNPAAQAWNHDLFWKCMTPKGGGKPDGELARQIDEDFGSFEQFATAFKNAATGQFGSGWAWLVLDNGHLKVTSTANADLPLRTGQHALLTCDVWEHAYYLDYQNERGKFVDVFLDKLVNWAFVAERFAMQGEGGQVAARKYQESQEAFAGTDAAEKGAKKAADALDSGEAKELEAARRASAKKKAS